jgi:site-specific recombinase XerD
MIKTFHHIFYQKKPKTYKTGPIPIYLRITVDGKRAEISINREVDPDQWLSKAGRQKGKSDAARQFNSHLDALQSKLYEAHQALIRENKPITAETLKNRFTGAGEKLRTIIPIFQKHNDEMEALIPLEYAAGTLERFRITLSHLKSFLQWKFNVTDIELRQINHEFVADFDFYIRSVRKCANNTAVKYSKYFQKIIRICMANGWLEKDPFINFKVKLKVVDRAFLSEEELAAIQYKEFESVRLSQVRDIFIFSCFTGLAYADVLKLTPGHVSTGIDGEKWLFVNRTKTDTPSRVPLLPVPLEIIEKYSSDPVCNNKNKLLPVSSNQKMNAYLKEIATVCNIPKDLTFHIARHTFATTVTLNNNVPIESVSKMLGHKTIKTTQHYAKLLDKKVSSDMHALRNKYTNQNQSKEQKIG